MRLLAPGVAALACAWLVQAALSERASGMSLERGEPEAAGIVVREARLRPADDGWRLDARVEIELPSAMRAGLDSGVALDFVLDLTLRAPRTLLPDRRLLEVERRYRLVYYELTRHYRVRALDGGASRNYRSLLAALEGLGTLRDVRIGALELPPASAGAGAPPRARLEMWLDGGALPLPLRSPFGSTWRLASEPLEWTPESLS